MPSNQKFYKTLPKHRTLQASKRSIDKFTAVVNLGEPICLSRIQPNDCQSSYFGVKLSNQSHIYYIAKNKYIIESNKRNSQHSKTQISHSINRSAIQETMSSFPEQELSDNNINSENKNGSIISDLEDNELVLRENETVTKSKHKNDLDKENEGVNVLNGISQDSGLTPDEAAAFDELSKQLEEHYIGKEFVNVDTELFSLEQTKDMTEIQNQEVDEQSQNLHSTPTVGELSFETLEFATIGTEISSTFGSKSADLIETNFSDWDCQSSNTSCVYGDGNLSSKSLNAEVRKAAKKRKRRPGFSYSGSRKRRRKQKIEDKSLLSSMENSYNHVQSDSSEAEDGPNNQLACSSTKTEISFETAVKTVLCMPPKYNVKSFKKFQSLLHLLEENQLNNSAVLSSVLKHKNICNLTKFNTSSHDGNKKKKLRLLSPGYNSIAWDEDLPIVKSKSDENELLINSAVVEIDFTTYIRETDVKIQEDLEEISTEKPNRFSLENQCSICNVPSCRLGCICESLNHGSIQRNHCGKVECMISCKCVGPVIASVGIIPVTPGSVSISCLDPNVFKMKYINGETPKGESDNAFFDGFSSYNRSTTSDELVSPVNGNHFPEKTSILTKTFYFTDLYLDVYSRAAPCQIYSSELPDDFNELYQLAIKRKGAWVEELKRALASTAINGRLMDFTSSMSSSSKPVICIDNGEKADVLLSQSGSMIAFFNWTDKSDISPNSMFCCNKMDSICVYPWLTLNKPDIGKTWLFYEFSHNLIKTSRLWLLEIGVVLVVENLLTRLRAANDADEMIKHKISICHQRDLDGPDFVYQVSWLPWLLIYGPVSKNCIITDPSVALNYTKWFERTNCGPDAKGLFILSKPYKIDI